MTDEERIIKLGLTGQNYISMITGFGQSKDQYDREKDGHFLYNKKYEVKTESPYVTKNLVSFRDKQLGKGLSNDHLFFIVIEAKGYPHFKHNNKVFLARDPSKLIFSKYKKSFYNGFMIGFDLDQDALELFNTIVDDYYLKEFYKYRKGGP